VQTRALVSPFDSAPVSNKIQGFEWFDAVMQTIPKLVDANDPATSLNQIEPFSISSVEMKGSVA
jgi:hypothetical protein